jgi:cytosine/adenosine deaminase-related metal-dependent hydrolase
MRYISSDIVFPGSSLPVIDGVLVIDEAGKIAHLLDPSKEEIPESWQVEKYSGFLCPGFINAHCHLELSHLRNRLSRGKGLPHFISEIISAREAGEEYIVEAVSRADEEMTKEGIVAVGDIANTSSTIPLKRKSGIFYHTFIELFDVSPERTAGVYEAGRVLSRKYEEAGLHASLAAHAPYSVTSELLRMISQGILQADRFTCIHNQETESENTMFANGAGALLDKLKRVNPVYNSWKATGRNSLASWIENFDPDAPVQLVHNTYTSAEDLSLAKQKLKHSYWCLCPNANYFIEARLPDILLLQNENCALTIGTDSLASNDALSILSELKRIQSEFPSIEIQDLFIWSSLNGARFLRVDDRFGSFESGKSPGINLIHDVDIHNRKLKETSRVERLF